MGCCFSYDQEEANPLLGGQSRVKTDSALGHTNQSDRTAQSARRFRPPETIVLDQKAIRPIKIRPVRIASVDKRLEDHAELYNRQVERWFDLCSTTGELRSLMVEGNPGQNLHDLFYHVNGIITRTEGAAETVSVRRRYQYCMQIEYDESIVPYTVAPAFTAFNKANRLVKEIVDKGPPLVNSVGLVVQDEKSLRREVLVASLGADGPDCMKNCVENITELRRVPGVVEDIKTNAIRMFEEMKAAVAPLTESTTE